jgi:transposase
MPHDLPRWYTVYQQSQRWLKAGVFEAFVQDLRAIVRLAQGRQAEPSAAICESRTLPSPPERGTRAGDDGAKRKRGSKVHMAVDTLGHLRVLHGTPANVQDRAQVAPLAAAVQQVSGESVAIASVEQGYTGTHAAQAAEAHHRQLEVVKLAAGKKGFVLLPKRWVVARSSGWAGRLRRLVRDDAQLAETLQGLHCVAFAILMLQHFVDLMVQST